MHNIYFYRPERSWAKVMFLQASVILLTGGCVCQVPPPGPGTPPGTRCTPQDQVPPQDQVHPPGTRYTPRGPGTPPRDQVHPPEIRPTSGRYASYWNAFLFKRLFYLLVPLIFVYKYNKVMCFREKRTEG